MRPIVGKRYKCKGCHNFDYCESCFEKNKNTHKHEFQVFEKPIYTNTFKIEEKNIHKGYICDGCEMNPIVGKRFKCKECNDFDYCEQCYEKNKKFHKHEFNEIKIPVNTVKKEEKENKAVHFLVICDGCNKGPIRGNRYKCKVCDDFDYCQTCYEKNKLSHGHEFNLIEKPLLNHFFFGMNPFNFTHRPRHCFKNAENSKEMHHCPTMGNLMNKNEIKINTEPKNENKIIHYGVKCDGCGVYPIVGCRFKCVVCDDFDYCEGCEKKLALQHGHPLLKIRDPKVNINSIKNKFKK